MEMSIGSIKNAYNAAVSNPQVQAVANTWNTWRNAHANIFSEDANKIYSKFPGMGDKYSAVRNAVMGATGGFVGSKAATMALRYEKTAEKVLNPVIQKGIEVTAKAGHAINGKIDDVVERINKEVELNNDETPIKKAAVKETDKSNRGYEDLGIRQPDAEKEQDYFPGSKTINKYC